MVSFISIQAALEDILGLHYLYPMSKALGHYPGNIKILKAYSYSAKGPQSQYYKGKQ